MSETADIRVSEGVKLTGMDAGWANAEDLQRVFVWDIGPEKPRPPQRPTLPKNAKEGDPEHELAKVEFQELLEDYQVDLKTFKQKKTEYADFQQRYGGPVEVVWWSVDARQNMEKDAAAVREGRQSRLRYYVSARTRGWKGKVANLGLPEGMKPGPGQAEVERRAREEGVLLSEALRADPVFGQQELR
jgi:hypothetical protein